MGAAVLNFNEQDDYNQMMTILKNRKRILSALGFDQNSHIFSAGDTVGFFHGPSECDFSFGTLLTKTNLSATILSDGGTIHEVSIFSLFSR